MDNIADIPYFEAEFDKNGKLSGTPPALPPGTTDLFIISHGWNNNRVDAQRLYRDLFTNFKTIAPVAMMSGCKPAIIGVIWPSKQFDELVAVESTSEAGGGGASIGNTKPDPESEKKLRDKLDRLKDFFNEPEQQKALEDAKGLIKDLETKETARVKFVETVRKLIANGSGDKEDASDIFFRSEPEEIMDQLRILDEDTDPAVLSGGGAAFSGPGAPTPDVGGAAGLADFLKGFKASAMNVLNYTTYYEMKERAGTVGKNGVAGLTDNLAPQITRIHLIGHSFGGRVVTAAAANSSTDKIRSMTLLQAAFSHNGFSQTMRGFFRSVVDRQRVQGPILVTHTKNDKAVGAAYPIASRLAGQIASALGDENDKYGGIGRNGAQKMNPSETVTGELQEVGKSYSFVPGKFFNLEGKTFIKDHGDVTGKEIAYAIALASLRNT